MSGRYFLLIPALFIDGIQAMLSLSLAGIVTTAGGVLSLIPIVGTALASGVIGPTGIVLGFVLNFIISATFGALLVTFLGISGAFYPRYLAGAGGEFIPGINNLPFWTLFTFLCVRRKNQEEREEIAKVGETSPEYAQA